MLTTGAETRILCEIQSDLSAADEKKFQEKNKHFWSLQKHYFRVEYSIRVLIGPADIRFELWFNDQKLSRDESIKVEWMPASTSQTSQTSQTPQTPQIAEMPAATPAIEMSVAPPTPVGNAPPQGAFENFPGATATKPNTFAFINRKTVELEDRKPRGRGGLFGRSAIFSRAASHGS